MSLRVALLRAVNLPRYGKVSMSDLRAFFIDVGFADAQTLLQTGNVVFDASSQAGAGLEALLEAEAAQRLGLRTDVMVRTGAEIEAIVNANPFPDEAAGDPGHLLVMFLKDQPRTGAVDALQAAVKGREVIRAGARELYIVYPDGIGRSKLTNSLIESKLGTRGTGRNWNTVLKLAELLRDQLQAQ